MQPSPASDRRPPAHIGVVAVRQTDWDDVALKSDRLIEAQQRQVVLESARVELGVGRDDLDAAFDVRVWLLVSADVVLAQSQQQIGGRDTGWAGKHQR